MENSNPGWIKISREIENWDLYFSEPFTRAQAWMDMILIANFKPSVFFIRGNQVEVKRGEIAWSEERICARWKWGRHKLRNFWKYLEKEQQISIIKTAAISKINVINYEKYQGDRTTDVQQTYNRRTTDSLHKKNDKKEKNVKNTLLIISRDERNLFEEFWGAYPRKVSRKKAEQTWKRLEPSEELTKKIVAHVESQKRTSQWTRDGGEYIPHPTTYLNQERWKDDPVIAVIPVEEKKTRAQLLREAANACGICRGKGIVDVDGGAKRLCECQGIFEEAFA